MDTSLLKIVISTLNTVEVKGEENMDKILACIRAIRSVVKEAENQEKPVGADNG